MALTIGSFVLEDVTNNIIGNNYHNANSHNNIKTVVDKKMNDMKKVVINNSSSTSEN